MVKFTTTIQRFDKQGEKTRWTYIEISARQASQLKNSKVSFRVRGKLDNHPISQVALLPMGEGNFIMPLKASLRKAIGKKHGDKVTVAIEAETRAFVLSPALMKCLKDEPEPLKFFKSLSGSHQKYFSKWIDDAKTAPTKAKRIAMALIAFSNRQGFPEMIRANRGQSR